MNTFASNRLAGSRLRAVRMSIRRSPLHPNRCSTTGENVRSRLLAVWPKVSSSRSPAYHYPVVRAHSIMESKEGRAGAFSVRQAEEKDLAQTAEVILEAFNTFNASIGQSPAFSEEESQWILPMVTDLHAQPKGRLAVAVSLDGDGKQGDVIGMAGLRFDDPVVSVQLLAVSTHKARSGVGRAVLSFILDLVEKERGGECLMSLTQDTMNAASFALYASLGFDVVELLTNLEGFVPERVADEAISAVQKEGTYFRKMEERDVSKCNELFMRVFGQSRMQNIQSRQETAEPQPSIVGVRLTGKGEEEEVVAYSTSLTTYGHSLAIDEQHFMALVSFASKLAKSEGHEEGFFQCMSRVNPAILRWALKAGLRIKGQSAWMVKGGKVSVNPEFVYGPGLDY